MEPIVGNIPGDGRENPKPAQRINPLGSISIPELNIARGHRIRVIEDNGRRGLVGLEGVVVQSYPGSVIVELEHDPMLRFRAEMAGGFTFPTRPPKRHFRVTEVERL